ncbi:50S ribosomal protein L37e [Candidatus Aenigmatarchaeota archaeon]
MVKGTTSKGRHNKITHIRCRRCGRHSYNMRKKTCSACGYPLSKLKKDKWKWKTVNRKKRKPLKKNHQKIKTVYFGRKITTDKKKRKK